MCGESTAIYLIAVQALGVKQYNPKVFSKKRHTDYVRNQNLSMMLVKVGFSHITHSLQIETEISPTGRSADAARMLGIQDCLQNLSRVKYPDHSLHHTYLFYACLSTFLVAL